MDDMSDLFENSIEESELSLEDILAEFHSENDYADPEPEDSFSPDPASFDLPMEQVQEDVAVNPDGSIQQSERFPTAAEIRAYLDSVKDKDFLNISEDISIKEIAEESFMSCCGFIRKFKNALGVTPYAYLKQLRIRTANALRNEGMTLEQAAEKCGYSDASTLLHAISIESKSIKGK